MHFIFYVIGSCKYNGKYRMPYMNRAVTQFSRNEEHVEMTFGSGCVPAGPAQRHIENADQKRRNQSQSARQTPTKN